MNDRVTQLTQRFERDRFGLGRVLERLEEREVIVVCRQRARIRSDAMV